MLALRAIDGSTSLPATATSASLPTVIASDSANAAQVLLGRERDSWSGPPQ